MLSAVEAQIEKRSQLKNITKRNAPSGIRNILPVVFQNITVDDFRNLRSNTKR